MKSLVMPQERITHGLSETAYHSIPALSATGAWTLASDCPAVYWHTSPFNPDAAQGDKEAPMDIGTALHLAALEPDRLQERTVIVDANDWRTKAAKEARADTYAAGKVPLLTKDIDCVGRLHAALLANEHAAKLLKGSTTEVSYFWEADGIPFKARADIITRDGAMADLKASASASPQFFQRQAFNAGHFLRDPFYRDGFELAGGARPRDYWFVIVAREEPHLVTVARLDEQAIEWGRMNIRRAVTMFKRCRDSNRWPGYCEEPMTLGLPDWAHYRLADQEQEGRFDPAKITRADVRRGFDYLAP